MDYNVLENLRFCGQIVADSSALLYYTHVPSAIVAILLGAYVLYRTRALSGVLLFALSCVFSAWAVLNLIIWIQFDKNSLMITAWSILGVLSVFIYFLTHWFVHLFVTERTLPTWMLVFWSLLIAPVLIFTPTALNLSGVDIQQCVAIEGQIFLDYYYALGALAMLFSIVSMFMARKNPPGHELNAAKWLIFTGAELFLLSFLTTGFIASYLVDSGLIPDFGLEQYGIATMALFMGILAYATVRYHAFNLKLLAAQALVLSLVILIASEFTFVTSEINRILVGVTLALAVLFGYFLVRSVKQEVRHREEIERLSQEKSEFMSFASHEIRNPLTAMKGYASLILEGDEGEISPGVRDAATKIMVTGNQVVSLISQFLEKSKLELGQLQYNAADFDIVASVRIIADGLRPLAQQRGLTLTTNIDPNLRIMVHADENKVKEVVGNIIDNSIKYTRVGSVTVSVEKRDANVVISVADTGAGIAPEVLPHLFKKFSRADAQKLNLFGTGLGLYLSRMFVEAQGGKIWAESEGRDKGSRFFIELPVI